MAEHWRLESPERVGAGRAPGTLRLAPAPQTDAAHSDPVARSSASGIDWVADPADPVPTVGGPICCTGTPQIRGGSVDQQAVERRDDVLVFTSAPFERDTAYAGPARATLWVSSEAPDLDLVVRITDVDPQGVSMNVQEGAQRVSLRNGPRAYVPLVPGEPVRVEVGVRELAWRFGAGHRLRVQVAASAFPRLARNPQTGDTANRARELRAARHRLWHDDRHPSGLWVHRLPR